MFRFEKLDVLHRSIELADVVSSAILRFPVDERFGLSSQVRPAAVSASSNIAEGSGRISGKDFARFIEVAYGSLMEVVSQSLIAKRQRFLNDEQLQTGKQNALELARMLLSLRKRLSIASCCPSPLRS